MAAEELITLAPGNISIMEKCLMSYLDDMTNTRSLLQSRPIHTNQHDRAAEEVITLAPGSFSIKENCLTRYHDEIAIVGHWRIVDLFIGMNMIELQRN